MDSGADTICITNYVPETTEQEIRTVFDFCGSIKKLEILEDRIILTFENPSSVKTALLLDQVLVQDKAIKVQIFEAPKAEPPKTPAEPLRAEASPTQAEESEPNVKVPLFPEAPLYSLNAPAGPPPIPTHQQSPGPVHHAPQPQYVLPPGYPPAQPQYGMPPAGYPAQYVYPPAYQPAYAGSVHPQAPYVPPHSQLPNSHVQAHPLPLDLINCSIYVTGLSATSSSELVSFFKFCGDIRGFSHPEDSQEGLIQFSRPDMVTLAKQMTGAHLKGAKIKVNGLSCYGDDPHTKAVTQLLSNFTTQLPS